MAKKKSLEYIAQFSRAAITLVLLMFVVLFAQLIVVELAWIYAYKKQPLPTSPDSPDWRIQNASKMFLPDGTIHLVNSIDTQRNGDYAKEEITDVNGLVLWQGISKDRPFKYLDWELFMQNFDEQQMQYMSQLSPELPGFIEAPVRISGELKEVWRYDFEAQVFAGYETGGGLIGYLGADGFVDSKTQAKPFGEFKGFTSWTDEDPSSVVMLWQTKHRICQIDFRSHQVKTLFESTQSDIEFILWHHWRPTNPKDVDDSGIRYRPLIYCSTADKKYHLIMREPNQILTVETPEQWPLKVPFIATSNAVFLEYREGNPNPPKSQKLMKQYWQEYSSKPQPQSIQLYKVIDDSKLELVNRFDWTKPVIDPNSVRARTIDRWEIYHKWTSKTSPPAFDLLWYLFDDALTKLRSEGRGMMREYADMIIQLRPSRIGLIQYQQNWSSANCLLSAVMIGFALWHGWPRRTSWGKLILWLIIVGSFNLAGLLTYLALNHTPVIKCPACGKKRGLEMDNCAQCGSPLPIPQRKPTDLIMAN